MSEANVVDRARPVVARLLRVPIEELEQNTPGEELDDFARALLAYEKEEPSIWQFAGLQEINDELRAEVEGLRCQAARVAELESEVASLREKLDDVIADADERVAAAFRVAEVKLKNLPYPPDCNDHKERSLWMRIWLAEQAAGQAKNIMAKAQRQRDAMREVLLRHRFRSTSVINVVACVECGAEREYVGDEYFGECAENCAIRTAMRVK